MKPLDWNREKSLRLLEERNICFEDISVRLEEKGAVNVISHPNQKKYPGQKMFTLLIDGYGFLIPFVEDDEKIFLKTIIPSRKLTKHLRDNGKGPTI